MDRYNKKYKQRKQQSDKNKQSDRDKLFMDNKYYERDDRTQDSHDKKERTTEYHNPNKERRKNKRPTAKIRRGDKMKTKKTEAKKEDVKPESQVEVRYRSGLCGVTIFSQEIDTEKYGKRKVFTFNLQRSYKDKEDKWQHTNSFRKTDVPNVQALMNRVLDFLYINEDEEDEKKE